MTYAKGDRVRMVNNPAQVGTVTGERDQMFLSFCGVQWQSGDFGFVAPSNLELDTPNIVGQSKPSPDGKVLTDWQTRAEGLERELSASGGRNIDLLKRAERAEAKVARVQDICVSARVRPIHLQWMSPRIILDALDADQ